MAFVKKCDRCGDIYATIDCNKPWTYSKDIEIKKADDESGSEAFDLCPKCRADIFAFVKDGEEL